MFDVDTKKGIGVRRFKAMNGRTYEHILYHLDDDRIELRECGTTDVILTYSSSCNVFENDGNLYGRLMIIDNGWVFQDSEFNRIPLMSARPIESNLDCEIIVSRKYIDEKNIGVEDATRNE